jgi:hypothetical protein
MAAEGVGRDQHRIQREHDAADPDSEASVTIKSQGRVVAQNHDVAEREIQRVTVEVLKNQEPRFTPG